MTWKKQVWNTYFPNGRPALEKGFGVYMTDLNTVNLSEQMKVTVCLNPVHSATGPLGVVLGYDLFAHMLNTNEDMMKMARIRRGASCGAKSRDSFPTGVCGRVI